MPATAHLEITLAGHAESDAPSSSFTHATHGPDWWPVVAAAVDATRSAEPLDLEVLRSSYSRDEGRLTTVLLRVDDAGISADEPGLGWDDAARRRLPAPG
ncbi:hypothetical protein ACFQ0K_11025 [Nocardioides caeni]|uniref:Uncharacterized protein n=1 Tax=Nocardioides caeni TaxID=574700 RepID=A0A4S8N1Y8_9ACTN|nr:hypothetical protein [Nocardioides caeni]THV09928.1 hypothetical protein E9934_15540 [Nocardioides caeni]